jgi:hypothetical protein
MSLAKRYDNWFDELEAWPGSVVVDGPAGALLVKTALGDELPEIMNIDVIGIGSSVYDSLKTMYDGIGPINSAEG